MAPMINHQKWELRGKRAERLAAGFDWKKRVHFIRCAVKMMCKVGVSRARVSDKLEVRAKYPSPLHFVCPQ